MLSTNVDYVNIYFEYPNLTKIHGNPSYDTLRELKKQLKANASSVTSDLGGGANGHLGLVCTTAEYESVSVLPYLVPLHPGVLIIPPNTTQYAATILREDHKSSLRILREKIDVQKALTKKIVQTVDAKYLNSLRNCMTKTINIDVHDILAHLMSHYRVIEDDTLGAREQRVREMQYDLLDPLVMLFSEIEDLALLQAIHAQLHN